VTPKPSLPPTLPNSENIKPDSVYKPGYFNQMPIPTNLNPTASLNQFQLGANSSGGQFQAVKSPNNQPAIISPTNPQILVNNPAGLANAQNNPQNLISNQAPRVNGAENLINQANVPFTCGQQILSPNHSNSVNQPMSGAQQSTQIMQPVSVNILKQIYTGSKIFS
jgi:hypothetical protein